MSELVQATGIYEEMIARLPSCFRDKPRIAAILQALANQLTANEGDFFTILLGGYIDNATGHDLEVLGDIVGEKNQGFPDDEYRQYIRARIKTNRSDGQIEQLIAIAVLILGTAIPVVAREFYPAALEFEVTAIDVNGFILWRNFLNRAKASAVKLNLIYGKELDAAMLIGGSFYSGALPAANDPGSSWTVDTGGGETAGVFG